MSKLPASNDGLGNMLGDVMIEECQCRLKLVGKYRQYSKHKMELRVL
jgi:hypothetical protein